MTRAFPPWLRCGCALVLSAVGPATLATGPELTRGEPAAAGFSPVRLERLHGFMQQVTGLPLCRAFFFVVAPVNPSAP